MSFFSDIGNAISSVFQDVASVAKVMHMRFASWAREY